MDDDTEYCCCCRVRHPRSLMLRLETRQGGRWRCVSSLEAARRSPAERDDFGRQQTARNSEAARQTDGLAIRTREWFSRT